MKTIRLLFVALSLTISFSMQAQLNVSINITPPDWGPAEASGVRFYFIPDIQAYYDCSSKVFIYRSGTTWVRTATLPGRYGTFNLYTGYKVILTDADGDRPYEHFDDHCRKFPKGYGREKHQKTWKEDGHHDNGNHYGEKKHDHDEDGDHDNGNHGHGHGHGHD